MRLSEAILLGQPLIAKPAPATLWSCAFGMALAAIGKAVPVNCTGQREEQGYAEFRLQWPWLTRVVAGAPCHCDSYAHNRRRADDVITHLFDSHVAGLRGVRWTLWQLADYVRSIEPAEPSEAVCGEGPNQVSERAELLKV